MKNHTQTHTLSRARSSLPKSNEMEIKSNLFIMFAIHHATCQNHGWISSYIVLRCDRVRYDVECRRFKIVERLLSITHAFRGDDIVHNKNKNNDNDNNDDDDDDFVNCLRNLSNRIPSHFIYFYFPFHAILFSHAIPSRCVLTGERLNANRLRSLPLPRLRPKCSGLSVQVFVLD